MIILIEGLIGIILFTIIEVSLLLKNPLTFIGDYPPAIQKKCIELKLIPEKKTRYTKHKAEKWPTFLFLGYLI